MHFSCPPARPPACLSETYYSQLAVLSVETSVKIIVAKPQNATKADLPVTITFTCEGTVIKYTQITQLLMLLSAKLALPSFDLPPLYLEGSIKHGIGLLLIFRLLDVDKTMINSIRDKIKSMANFFKIFYMVLDACLASLQTIHSVCFVVCCSSGHIAVQPLEISVKTLVHSSLKTRP